MPFSTAREFIKDINVNSYLEHIVEENMPLLHDFAHRVNVKLDDFLVKLIIDSIKNCVKAMGFYTVEAMLLSKEFFDSIHTFLFQPPLNFSDANIFHPLVQSIYNLILDSFTDFSLLRLLVRHAKPNFCNDLIHYSKKGSYRNYHMFTKFLDLLGKQKSFTTSDFQNLTTKFNEISHLEDKEATFSTKVKNKHYERNTPIKNTKRRKQFEREHYKFLGSEKSIALLTDGRHLKFQSHDKFFVMHTDSPFRELCSDDQKIRKSFFKGKGYFRFPNLFTISPGATVFDLYKELQSHKFKNSINHNAMLSILAFGTNEILQLYDLVNTILCDRNLISSSICCVCIRNAKKCKPAIFFKRKPHGLPNVYKSFDQIML